MRNPTAASALQGPHSAPPRPTAGAVPRRIRNRLASAGTLTRAVGATAVVVLDVALGWDLELLRRG